MGKTGKLIHQSHDGFFTNYFLKLFAQFLLGVVRATLNIDVSTFPPIIRVFLCRMASCTKSPRKSRVFVQSPHVAIRGVKNLQPGFGPAVPKVPITEYGGKSARFAPDYVRRSAPKGNRPDTESPGGPSFASHKRCFMLTSGIAALGRFALRFVALLGVTATQDSGKGRYQQEAN